MSILEDARRAEHDMREAASRLSEARICARAAGRMIGAKLAAFKGKHVYLILARNEGGAMGFFDDDYKPVRLDKWHGQISSVEVDNHRAFLQFDQAPGRQFAHLRIYLDNITGGMSYGEGAFERLLEELLTQGATEAAAYDIHCLRRTLLWAPL